MYVFHAALLKVCVGKSRMTELLKNAGVGVDKQ